MPRPKSKPELVTLSKDNYSILIQYIENLSAEERDKIFPESYMNRSISDVLYHLYHWHLMFFEWYRVGMEGEKPDMPAKGFTWKTCPELNRLIWEKYKSESLENALNHLASSHHQIMDIIEKHSNEELFEKKRYKWTGSTSLGAYLISASSSHYDWALKLIKKALK